MQPRLTAALALLALLCACSSPEERAEAAREAALEALGRGDGAAALEALGELRDAQPETADAALDLAGLLVQAGDAAQAVWLLEDAVTRFPERYDLGLALGRAALLVSDPSGARRAVEAIPAESEHHPGALLVRAQAELLLGDLEASLAILEQAETLHPDLPEVRIPRIAALLGERRYDEAAGALERAKAEADSEEARIALRRLEVALYAYRGAQGEREAAIAALRRMVDEDPTDVAAWTALVELVFREGRGEQARDLLRGAMDADPENRGLLPVLASAHALLGEDAEAERVLRQLLEESASPAAHLALAQFHVVRDREEAALAAVDAGIAAFPETSLLRLYRAEYLIDLGRLDDARAELERSEELAVDNPEREYVRARLELAEGDVDAARARLEQVLPALDSSAAHFWLGRALELQGDLAGAERRYGLALARDPSDPSPPLYLMRLAERSGNWQAVASAGRLAVQRAPGRFEGWSGLVTALVNLGRGEPAEEVAHQVLERFPDRVESHLLMTAALRAQGKHGEALAQLDAARERFGPSAGLAAERALTLALAGDSESAISAARRGLETSPDSARLHAVLAAVLFLRGTEENVAEGERAIERALELDPADPEPYRTRAGYRAATGDLDGARADCEAYLEVRANDSEVLFILGLVHEKSGRPDAAIAAYRRAAEADPRAFAPRNNLALRLDAKGDLDGAIEAAQQAYRLAEDDPSAMDTLAALYLKKGLVERSVSLLEEAHAKAPEKPAVQLHLAMAYRDAGRTDDARRLLTDLRPRTGEQPQLRAQVDEAIATLP